MSDNTPMSGHYREAYGLSLVKLITVMYGAGVEPGRVRMERAKNPTSPTRAQFDILLRADDGAFEYIFESKTIEDLDQIAVVIDLVKELILVNHQAGKVEMTDEGMFKEPNPVNLRLAVQSSFNQEFANSIIPPNAANGNMREILQRAASQVQARPANAPKDPKRVAAGRKASATRYGRAPGASSTQTSAPKL